LRSRSWKSGGDDVDDSTRRETDAASAERHWRWSGGGGGGWVASGEGELSVQWMRKVGGEIERGEQKKRRRKEPSADGKMNLLLDPRGSTRREVRSFPSPSSAQRKMKIKLTKTKHQHSTSQLP